MDRLPFFSVFALGVCFAVSPVPVLSDDSGFKEHAPAKVRLGQMLFFDKILSGNQNISCASCHHPLTSTTDGLSLGIGEGGRGLSLARKLEGVSAANFDVRRRIPRNAPALFNLGHEEFRVMFHDGRVAVDPRSPSGFSSPAGEQLPSGLESALAAQAMFPPTSSDEMAGPPGSNPVANAVQAGKFAGPDGVWELLASRIRAIPEYVTLFRAAFPSEVRETSQITFVQIANAIAAFESTTWRADHSPFDRFMKGEQDCMSREARAGLDLFLGKGQCSSCHSGKFQTDHRFHSIAMPQIGPGKGDGESGNHDFGRERVTKNAGDRYKFRTPSLRNIALTAPYGHCGAYPDLESVIRHHLNPSSALANYNATTTRMPSTNALTSHDAAIMRNRNLVNDLASQSEIRRISLTDKEVSQIIDFLHCLTDPRSLNLLRDIPARVPSGLPIFD